MKTKRVNKTKQVKQKYVDELVGHTAVLKSIPKNIKKAKRLFKVDKAYIIQKPPSKFINSKMCVFLKGSDGKIYQVPFMHYVLTAK